MKRIDLATLLAKIFFITPFYFHAIGPKIILHNFQDAQGMVVQSGLG